MDVLGHLASGFAAALTPGNLLMAFVGSLLGTLVGVLPGLGPTAAILLNIPGEVASVPTCLDGYPMAQQGRGGVALGIAAIGSFFAGTFGVGVLTFFSPLLA